MKSKKTHKKVIERNLLIIELAIKTGLRRGEITNLLVKDINLERGYIEVHLGKGEKDRIVDLTAIVTAIARSIYQREKDRMIAFLK